MTCRLGQSIVNTRLSISILLPLDSTGSGSRIMNVGILKVKLRLPDNHSLKGKRQAIKPVVARVKNQFNVSVAEIDDNDLWQLAMLGICCVSNDQRFTNEVLSKVVDFIKGGRFDVELLDYEIEILPI